MADRNKRFFHRSKYMKKNKKHHIVGRGWGLFHILVLHGQNLGDWVWHALITVCAMIADLQTLDGMQNALRVVKNLQKHLPIFFCIDSCYANLLSCGPIFPPFRPKKTAHFPCDVRTSRTGTK